MLLLILQIVKPIRFPVLLLMLFFFKPAGAFVIMPDSIVPTPSVPDTLSGPTTLCQYDTALYTADFPVSCSNIWLVDNLVQSSDSATLRVIWNDAGSHQVKACCNDTTNVIGVLNVCATTLPDVYLGEDTCLQQGQTLLLDAGNPGCTYLWNTGDTTRTLLVYSIGNYWVEATNHCGSDADTIFVDYVTEILRPENPKISFYASNGKLILKDIKKGDKLFVYSQEGKLLYGGHAVSNLPFQRKSLLIIRLLSGRKVITGKIYLP